jgi:hypothetical protein
VFKKRLKFIFLFCFFFTSFHAFSADYDGSRPLSGVVNKLIEINKDKINDDVDPDTVGLPKSFIIDFKEKIVLPTKDSLVRRISKIKRVEHIENKLILQGIEEGVEGIDDGLGWSMAISKETGAAVLVASDDQVAYVVFGTCTPAKNYHP